MCIFRELMVLTVKLATQMKSMGQFTKIDGAVGKSILILNGIIDDGGIEVGNTFTTSTAVGPTTTNKDGIVTHSVGAGVGTVVTAAEGSTERPGKL